ncbi:hypothetical protein D3H35_10720 [Cohnella faecalis]|uniref:Uncharacterized protein n=1 Tax=Cohnella faecalis TaxID=2315694 RepID=A0A398CX78_9BACL|nr:hypothetical protein D3H35_10720 [Cohnella faecalis]
MLSKETVTEASWKMFVMDSGKTRFRYKIIYRAVDFRDVELPWMETDEERLTIPILFRRSARWKSFRCSTGRRGPAFVDVSYEDPNNGVLEEQSFEFNDKSVATGRFVVALQDANRRQSDSKRRLFAKTERCPRFRSRIPSRDVLP